MGIEPVWARHSRASTAAVHSFCGVCPSLHMGLADVSSHLSLSSRPIPGACHENKPRRADQKGELNTNTQPHTGGRDAPSLVE